MTILKKKAWLLMWNRKYLNLRKFMLIFHMILSILYIRKALCFNSR